MKYLDEWIIKLYHSDLMGSILHTPIHCLKEALRECDSVLDLGCGPDSILKDCRVKSSLGVEIYEPFLTESRNKEIHDKYILASVNDVDFAPESFDAVIMIELLEHLPKEKGCLLLEKAVKWSRRRVIVSTPNGFLSQSALSGNPYEVHCCGWDVDEMRRLGFKAYGLSGFKFLRKANTSEGYGSSGNAIFSTLRFKPYFFWTIISGLSQIIAYFLPKLAYGVFYIKECRN